MSLQPRSWPEPAEEITRAVLGMYGGRRAPLPIAVRDELGELFADAEFADAFADRGPQGWSPGRLALVTVFQAAENRTDRQAAEAVRDKISWKYALGLGLSDGGFDFSVLSEFRARIVAHSLQARVLDLLVARLADLGLLQDGLAEPTRTVQCCGHPLLSGRDGAVVLPRPGPPCPADPLPNPAAVLLAAMRCR